MLTKQWLQVKIGNDIVMHLAIYCYLSYPTLILSHCSYPWVQIEEVFIRTKCLIFYLKCTKALNNKQDID